MKFKALLLALAVAGVGASFGLTDTGRSDTGTTTTAPSTTTATSTTTTSSDGCRKFELKGTFASVSASSFSATVTQGSDAVKGAAGTVVTFAVTADTRVSWRGRGTLTGPNVGDSVKVNGKQCGGTSTALKVDASSPKADKKKDEHPKGDSSTTTTTTEKHGKSKK